MAAGVYIHIPFCISRCSYCDFATDLYRDREGVSWYVDALCTEILSRDERGDEVDTIYFGGGTPSLLEPRQIEAILECIRAKFRVADDPEVTLEMNPGTVTREKLSAYRQLGINRASFGVQTFNDFHLKLLGRGHNAADSQKTFDMLGGAGFGNISMDMIAGLPGQTMSDWKFNLGRAIELGPQHLSLYLLEIHEGTPLAIQLKTGRRPPPDPELAADMYEEMIDGLAVAGYEQYEISNFAKHGFESRHNSKYWTLDPVYGFGVSAHSFDGKERYANERDTVEYLSAVNDHRTAETFREKIDRSSEYIFLGLRLTRGIDLELYANVFGQTIPARYPSELARLNSDRLVETQNDRLRLTRKGMLFSNQVFAEFV
jgi:oxygen-independent coproporphyrinogen III oxidase